MVGEGESRADELLVFAAGEATKLRQVVLRNFRVGCRDRDDLDLGSSKPRPDAVGGHGDGALAQKREADGGDGRDHGHADFPGVDDHEDVLAVSGDESGDARGAFGWCSVHGSQVRNWAAGFADVAG